MKKYEGVFPAFYACYDESGKVNPEGIRSFALHLVDTGISGLYIGGSSVNAYTKVYRSENWCLKVYWML